MKIIQYLPYSYHIHSGGLEKIAQTLSDGLNQEMDAKVTNIASNIRRGKGGDFTDYEDTIFISSFDLVHNFPIPKFWTRNFWEQFAMIKKYQPDVIMTHTRFFVQSLAGGLLAKWLGCARIHIEHGSGFVTGYAWYVKVCARLFDWTVGLWIFRQCDQIITISQMHKQFISQFTNKTPTIIYNPIDYQAQERTPRPTATPLNREDQRIIHIGFVGRLVSLKGVDLLIQALKGIEEQSRSCTIVGTGDQDAHLKQLTHDLRLSDRITFIGADDRTNWLHKFDVFVNPSYQEGVPTTVIEALFARCIVVTTDVGGTREISDQQDLILCRPGDIDDLKEKLGVAFTRLDQGGMSYKIVNHKFGIREAIKEYRNILFIQ